MTIERSINSSYSSRGGSSDLKDQFKNLNIRNPQARQKTSNSLLRKFYVPPARKNDLKNAAKITTVMDIPLSSYERNTASSG